MHFENYENALSLLKTNKYDDILRQKAIKYIINDVDSIITFISEKLYINNVELIYVKDVYLNYGIVQNPCHLKTIVPIMDSIDHSITYQIAKIFPSIAYEYISFVDEEFKRNQLINSMLINFKISCDFIKFKSRNSKERLMVVDEYMDDGSKLPDLLNSIMVDDESRKKVFHILKLNPSWIKSYIVNLDIRLFDDEKKYIHDNYQCTLFNRYSKNAKKYIEYCIIFRNCLNGEEIHELIERVTDEQIDVGYIVNIVNNVNMSEDDRAKFESMLVMDSLTSTDPLSLIMNII